MSVPERNDRIQQLAQKWQEGTITDPEKKEFEDWYNGLDNTLEISSGETRDQAEERLYRIILDKGDIIRRRDIVVLWRRIAAAACILLLAGVGFIFITKQSVRQAAISQDLSPARQQATLTLGNGEKIVLTGSATGQIARQGDVRVEMDSNRAVSYMKGNRSVDQPLQFNTLSTARGEQSPFPLVLADGTKVWLNAASSITFPVVFNGKERIVRITGEAWFEVVHNISHPFTVIAKGQTIRDIGTTFDVNAYDD